MRAQSDVRISIVDVPLRRPRTINKAELNFAACRAWVEERRAAGSIVPYDALRSLWIQDRLREAGFAFNDEGELVGKIGQIPTLAGNLFTQEIEA